MFNETNAQRTDRAYRTVLYYQQSYGDDLETCIIDLTADLLHLGIQYGINPNDLQRIAMMHYKAEQHEEASA